MATAPIVADYKIIDVASPTLASEGFHASDGQEARARAQAYRLPRRVGLSERVRRLWWRGHGEQAVRIAFWPRDYQQGKVYQIDGHFYRISRYFHAAESRFYEVWGREVDGES